MMGIVFSTRISIEAVVYLKSGIENHLSLFKNVFPNAPIIPKQHFLVHVPSHPKLVYAFWKDLAKKIKNFKNIAHSLTYKNQKVFCAEHMTFDCLMPMTSLSEITKVYMVTIWRLQKAPLLDFFLQMD